VKLHWWLRLRWYEWRNAWRLACGRRNLEILSWTLPCVVAPIALRMAGADTSAAAQDWVLSFDIPLALLLAVVVTVQATPTAVRAAGQHDDAWIFPLASHRLVALFQRLHDLGRAARWPLRFGLAGLLLGAGLNGAALTEWLIIALLAFIAGVVLARLQAPSPSVGVRMWSGRTRSQGLAALSAVPLRAAWQQLDPRRVFFLCVPVLLAAPMGTPVYKIALGVASWLPLVYLATCCREAANTIAAMQRWQPLPRAPLYWWVWRHVALLIVASAGAAWTLWHFLSSTNLRSKA
jgi:hypothetical protein